MNTLTQQAWALMGVGAILALLALAAWFFTRRKKSHHLQQRFGAEYGRAVDEIGNRAKVSVAPRATLHQVEVQR